MFHQEDWGTVVRPPSKVVAAGIPPVSEELWYPNEPGVVKYTVEGEKRQEEIISTIDYITDTWFSTTTDHFIARILRGKRVQQAKEVASTARVELSRSLKGDVIEVNQGDGVVATGNVRARVIRKDTREATKLNRQAEDLVEDYKTELILKGYREKALLLSVNTTSSAVWTEDGVQPDIAVNENDGAAIATGIVTRRGSSELVPLTITLTSQDVTEVTMPGSVVIPAGQSATTFPINAVDNDPDIHSEATGYSGLIQDGDQLVKIRATAFGHSPATALIGVLDDDD